MEEGEEVHYAFPDPPSYYKRFGNPPKCALLESSQLGDAAFHLDPPPIIQQEYLVFGKLADPSVRLECAGNPYVTTA